jgi:hypothetical protein
LVQLVFINYILTLANPSHLLMSRTPCIYWSRSIFHVHALLWCNFALCTCIALVGPIPSTFISYFFAELKHTLLDCVVTWYMSEFFSRADNWIPASFSESFCFQGSSDLTVRSFVSIFWTVLNPRSRYKRRW